MATKENNQLPKVMTVKEVAEYLRVHASTLYKLVKRGELPAFRIGSDWRFNSEAIDRWLIEQSSPKA
jgi:excisionase family DNA binding protein